MSKTARLLSIVAACTWAAAIPALASWTAYDEASDPAYAGGWTNNSNGGYGFSPWQLSPTPPTGNYGHFIGSSTYNGNVLDDGVTGGVATDSDIDTGTLAPVAWGMYANNGFQSFAIRMFNGSTLDAGQTFSVDFDNGWIVTDARITLALLSVSQSPLLQVFFVGGTSDYQYSDAGGTASTGIGFGDEGLNLSVTMTGPTSYSATLTRRDGASASWSGTVAQQVYGFGAQNNNAGGPIGGPNFDLYLNRLEVVPEPSTLALGAMGLLALALRRRMRN